MSEEKVIEKVKQLCEFYEKYKSETGNEYNLFSILKLERKEIRYSLFLADLLNPMGKHSQGTLFLELFIEEIKSKVKGIEKINPNDTRVDTETNVISKEGKLGRIDVFIEDDKNIIYIENKIDAKERENQLNDYSNVNSDGKEKIILFLTKYGRHPESTENKNVYPISYQEDILKWLMKCREKVADKHRLSDIITQYIEVVKEITNQKDGIMEQEMKKIILENYNEVEKLKDSFLKLVGDLDKKTEKLLESLKNKIKKELLTKNEGWEVNEDREKDNRGSIFLKNDKNDFEIGMEHFNPNFKEDDGLRDDKIFCGIFNEKECKKNKWSEKFPIKDFDNISLKTNSQEYIKLFFKDVDNTTARLVEHLFNEFEKYFNNNKEKALNLSNNKN